MVRLSRRAFAIAHDRCPDLAMMLRSTPDSAMSVRRYCWWLSKHISNGKRVFRKPILSLGCLSAMSQHFINVSPGSSIQTGNSHWNAIDDEHILKHLMWSWLSACVLGTMLFVRMLSESLRIRHVSRNHPFDSSGSQRRSAFASNFQKNAKTNEIIRFDWNFQMSFLATTLQQAGESVQSSAVIPEPIQFGVAPQAMISIQFWNDSNWQLLWVAAWFRLCIELQSWMKFQLLAFAAADRRIRLTLRQQVGEKSPSRIRLRRLWLSSH